MRLLDYSISLDFRKITFHLVFRMTMPFFPKVIE